MRNTKRKLSALPEQKGDTPPERSMQATTPTDLSFKKMQQTENRIGARYFKSLTACVRYNIFVPVAITISPSFVSFMLKVCSSFCFGFKVTPFMIMICLSFCFGFKGRSLMISSLSKQLVPQWQLVYLLHYWKNQETSKNYFRGF